MKHLEFVKTNYNSFDTFSTKELASQLNIKTSEAYKICTELEKYDVICKIGYKTKRGWEDPQESNLKPNSLHWQVN